MPIDTSNATAIVNITGLGMFCTNDELRRFETLFIHNKVHKPSIKLYRELTALEYEQVKSPKQRREARFEVTTIAGKSYRKLLEYHDLPLQGSNRNYHEEKLSIEIKGSGESRTQGIKKYFSPEKFDRLSYKASDLNDFRWVVNLEKDGLLRGMNGGGVVPDAKATKSQETSLLFIQNAELFTYDLVSNKGANQLFIRREIIKDADGKAVDIKHEDYGFVADKIGAVIDSEFLEIAIRAGGMKNLLRFPKLETPYILSISNAMPPRDGESTESDMPIYRSFWQHDGSDLDLVIQPELAKEYKDLLNREMPPPKGGSAVGVRRTCYLSEIARPNLSAFFR